MQQWQQWMQQGRHAWDQKCWQRAQWCYEQAFADVWPIWQHATLLPQTWSNDMDELCLPTHCMVVTIRNLAHTLQQQHDISAARQLIQHTQQWLHCALQQPHLPDVVMAALWQQQTELCQHWHSLHSPLRSTPYIQGIADTDVENIASIHSFADPHLPQLSANLSTDILAAHIMHQTMHQTMQQAMQQAKPQQNITARIFRITVAA